MVWIVCVFAARAQSGGLRSDIPQRALAIGAAPLPQLPLAASLPALEAALDNGTPGHCLALLARSAQQGARSPADAFAYAYLKAMALNRLEETDSALAVCACQSAALPRPAMPAA